ncbi:hypothetical protein CK203_088483 [Vitis vinifera]|uniref:DUF4283 domain-containing protein n=1 Tax=Vitis vinifera TaxID=29760 RepID=A0A438ELC2_VITVI|nr:hypothetical protein CK203_088483 [Vitis vinifera]
MAAKRGGRCWFAVESKSYEITAEEWRLVARGVLMLGHVKSWEDGGRRYKLEIRENKAGRRKKCFGRMGIVGRKLRFLGVGSREESKGTAAFYGTGCSDGEYGRKKCQMKGNSWDDVWWEDGDNLMLDPDMQAFESWGRSVWNTKGGVKFSRLGGPLLLIEFETKEEAEKVLLRGHRWFKESFLSLERWDPKVGCSINGERDKSVWVRVMGMPLHFWSQEILQKNRLLVRSEGLEWLNSLQVAVGSVCYSLQLWWEVKPGLTAVVPATRNEMGNEREVRDEGEGDSRAGFKKVNVRTHGEPAKVDVPCENDEGGCSKAAAFSEALSEKVADGVGSTASQHITWGKNTICGHGKSLVMAGTQTIFSFSVFLGKRDISLSSTPSGRNGESVARTGVIIQSSSSVEVGGAVMGPLRMIWADGREAEVLDSASREVGAFGEKTGKAEVLDSASREVGAFGRENRGGYE